jgi:predicted PurR-regulated permease PerM
VDDVLQKFGPQLQKFGVPSTRQAIVDQYVEPQRDQIAQAVRAFFNGFFGIVAGAAQRLLLLLIVPLLVFYFLSDMDTMRQKVGLWIPPSIRSSTLSVLGEIGQVFRSYLRGISTMALMYMVSAALILGLLGVPYFLLLAVTVGALYLIPIVGTFLSTALIFVISLLSGQNGSYWFHVSSPLVYAFICAISFIVMSSVIFDNLVVPRVVGKAVDLHPLVSMFVVMAAGILFGIPGMIIAFPLAGSLKVVLQRLMRIANQPTVEFAGLPAVPGRHRTKF